MLDSFLFVNRSFPQSNLSVLREQDLLEKTSAFLLKPLSLANGEIHPLTKFFLVLIAFTLWLPATLLGLWMANNSKSLQKAPLFNSLVVQYNAVESFPSEPPQFFFLGEDHLDPKGRQLNYQFIQAHAEKGVAIALESIVSTQKPVESNQATNLLREYQIELPPEIPSFIFGWDVPNISAIQASASEALIRGTFASRTQSMVQTIRNIKKWADLNRFKGKIFFLAGTLHLRTPLAHRSDPFLSLEEFYREVKNCNGVVLIPKHLRD